MTADAHELHHDIFQKADSDLNDLHQKLSATQKNTASSSPCQGNTICHANCGANMSTSASLVSSINRDTLNQHLYLPKYSFVTGTQYRPPTQLIF
jgi:hypothetical protein